MEPKTTEAYTRDSVTTISIVQECVPRKVYDRVSLTPYIKTHAHLKYPDGTGHGNGERLNALESLVYLLISGSQEPLETPIEADFVLQPSEQRQYGHAMERLTHMYAQARHTVAHIVFMNPQEYQNSCLEQRS